MMLEFGTKGRKIEYVSGKSTDDLVAKLNEIHEPYMVINITFAEGRHVAWISRSDERVEKDVVKAVPAFPASSVGSRPKPKQEAKKPPKKNQR